MLKGDELERHLGRLHESGDLTAAATVAVRSLGPEILGYLSAVMRDDEEALEAFSQFTENLWRALPGFRRESSFRSFSYKLAWHALHRVRRDPHRRRARRPASGEISGLVAEVRSATAPYLRSGARRGVALLRQSLGLDEQTLLILRVDRALSWADIAAILSLSEATLAKRFERVKAKLRRLALEAGLVET